MAKIADEYKSCNELKNVEKVTGEMEDIEEITTEVAERAQAYLDSRRDEELSARKIISKNWGQKTKAEDLQSARYQGDLKAVMDRYDQRKVTEGEKLWSKSSSGKIDRKMMLIKKANQLRWMISNKNNLGRNQIGRQQRARMVYQSCFKQKGCKTHQQLRKCRIIKECKPRETKRQREKADTHKAESRKWIYHWEWRWWINTSTEKKSRQRPKP